MKRDHRFDQIATRLDRLQPPVHDDLAELRSLSDEDFIAYARAWLVDAPIDSTEAAGLRHAVDQLETTLRTYGPAAQRQHTGRPT